MKSVLCALLASLALAAAPAFAADPARVAELVDVLRLSSQMEKMQQQMVNVMRVSVDREAARRGLDAGQRARVDKAVAIMQEEIAGALSWEAMRGEVMAVYAEVLSDAEVDAMLAFYRSPEGQSVLDKMPVLMERGMAIGQARSEAMMPRLQARIRAAFDEAASGGATTTE